MLILELFNWHRNSKPNYELINELIQFKRILMNSFVYKSCVERTSNSKTRMSHFLAGKYEEEREKKCPNNCTYVKKPFKVDTDS